MNDDDIDKISAKDRCQICGEPVSEVYVLLDGEHSNGMKSGHKRCLKRYEAINNQKVRKKG